MQRAHSLLPLSLVLLVACPDESTRQAVTYSRDTCDSTTTDLIAGKYKDVGDVQISHDEDTLYVTITTSGGWKMDDYAIDVGCALSDIPTTSSGNPKVGLFTYQSTFSSPRTAKEVAIPLSDITCLDACGEELVVAVHSNVKKGSVCETAWADGDGFPGASWATYVPYELTCCEEEPVEVCDGVDNTGEGDVDEGFTDTDGDGTADCVETEDCDGDDDDLDGLVDEDFSDADADGIADCIDTEDCDGVDNDGDGDTDEDYPDTDHDGVADCVDAETCDGLDNDGDHQIDEGFTDTDGDGTADCVDTETCGDGVDNDGDGGIDEGCPSVCVTTDLGTPGGYNLYVWGDYTRGLDVEGKVAAGGDISMQAFAVAWGDRGGASLVAGDRLTLRSGTVYGDGWYGGSASVASDVHFSGGSLRAGSPIDFVADRSAALATSALLDSLAATGSTVVTAWGEITLTGHDPVLNVFDLTATALAGATSFTIDAPSGSTVLVNISGTAATLQNFGYFLYGVGPEDVLYHFPDARTLQAQSIGIMGSTFAPYADATFNNGAWDGAFIAASFTGDAEGHRADFGHTIEVCP